VLGIVGSLDIPLLILAVRLWRGVHPAVMLAKDEDAGLKDPLMGWTLMVSAIALGLLFTWLVSLRARACSKSTSTSPAIHLEGVRT